MKEEALSDEVLAALGSLSSRLGLQKVDPQILAELVARGWAVNPEHFGPYLTAAGHTAYKAEKRRRGDGYL